ncbi:MAG TPA: penicillin-binding protein [Candidatus Acidoferrales bacterium]|nr:penicillin-binding protein [Candidatus Acidoferrales bacterium]
MRSSPARVLLVAVVATLWAGAALGRLAYLQLICHSDYLARAQRQQQRIVEISPKRGAIYDRNLRELALSISVDSCFAVPAEIRNVAMASRLLARALHTSAEEMEAKLSSSRSFVWVARKLSPQQVARIQALNLRGIYFQKENQRFYPKRKLAAHVIGHVDVDEKGLAGVEYAADAQIRGKPGRMLILADARRRWYDRNEQAADAGASAVLTLDEKIQYIAEKELATAIRDTHALAGTIIVQDPNSGELLAVSNWPAFNPNAASSSSADSRMDRAIGALYEPGSTFKLITLSAALEEGITRPEEVIDCQGGAIYIANHRIRDHKPFGLLNVAQILAHSSDVGAIKVGLRLGALRLYEYIRAFGFGSPTGIDLPGENRGLVRRVENWSAISIGAISMGQEVGVTPLQLATAVSAIANGGMLYRPHVLRELRRGPQVLPPEQTAPRRVLSPPTAATLRRMMEGVILEGTGKLARLDGYTAAGKTGTAQKIDQATGRYSPTKVIASFVGFAPLNNPVLTVLVTLDSPVGPHHGGEVAAPVFKRVAEQVLAYLDVPRDLVLAPSRERASNREQPTPPSDVSDFDAAQVEMSPAVEVVAPAEPVKAVAEPAVATAEGAEVTVPSLAGKTVRSVTEECLHLGLHLVLIGTGVAVEQSPEAGATVRRGARITVRFARSAALVTTSGRGR